VSSQNWKKHLLKTSVPLEHEAARVLSQAGFNVSASFPYYRNDGGVEKEFSVDVRGVLGYEPPGCVFDVLVECKYRDQATTWLFLPQPRRQSKQIHEAIQDVDLFSPRFVHGGYSLDDNDTVPVCYSAVEVGGGDAAGADGKGRALDSQLRHGVRQLQYALPPLLALRVRWVTFQRPEENYPFFFVPILLTNARLMVAHHDFGLEAVERAENLDSLGNIESRVIWSSELGPDFDMHCQRHLADLPRLAQTKNMKAVEEQRKSAGLADWLQPSAVVSRIAVDGRVATDIAEYTEVLVVNLEALPHVIARLRVAFENRAKSLKTKPLFMG
jgi:hypothetical protein